MSVKSREIKSILANKGMDKGIVYILHALAEDNSIMRQELQEIANQIINMSEILLKISQYNAETMQIMQKMSKIADSDGIDDGDKFQGGDG